MIYDLHSQNFSPKAKYFQLIKVCIYTYNFNWQSKKSIWQILLLILSYRISAFAFTFSRLAEGRPSPKVTFEGEAYSCPIFCTFSLSKLPLPALKLNHICCPIFCTISLSKLPLLAWKHEPLSCPIFCIISLSKLSFLTLKLKYIYCPIFCTFFL